jgi:hypothetical protein
MRHYLSVRIIEDVEGSAEWMAAALSSSGYAADFSTASLWEVERFFDEHAPHGQARKGGLLSGGLGQRLFGLGSYVGEVIRRGLGGEWKGDDSDPEAEINVALVLTDESLIWPVQRAMKRFQNGPEDSVVAYALALGLEVGERPPQRERKRRWFGR